VPERSTVFVVAFGAMQCCGAHRYVVAAVSDSRHSSFRSRRPGRVVPGATQSIDAVHVSQRISDADPFGAGTA
jgi:hypothetical protein